MSLAISHRSWDTSPKETNSFEILTRFTDLGSMESRKSILGFILNTTMSDTQATIPPPIYSFYIHYRISQDDNFTFLGVFELSYNELINPQGAREIKIILESPIMDVHSIQLRIYGSIRGNFGINDCGIIYRVYRDTSESSLEDE